jgi:hypothetical protein
MLDHPNRTIGKIAIALMGRAGVPEVRITAAELANVEHDGIVMRLDGGDVIVSRYDSVEAAMAACRISKPGELS